MSDANVLHIGVDGRELTGKPTGVGRYLAAILGEWAGDTAFPHRLTVWTSAEPPAALARFGDRITWAIERTSASSWWEQTTFPQVARQAGVDVFFAGGYTAPLRIACPVVLAVYDVSYFAHPEWFGWREGLRRRWLTKRSARRAASVVTISEFSASEIVRYLGISRDRIRLAPPGAPAAARVVETTSRPPLVLFVGSLFNRRRIPELIRGFALAAARVPEARLVLVGDNRTLPPIDPLAIANELGIPGQVNWRSYLDDTALQSLYQQARVFAFLSDYEGFAMTPLEAIAAGVPPILLDTLVAREVYRDAALLVTDDPSAIASAMTLLLTDPVQHAALLAAGQRRLERFSWTRAAREIRRALEEAAASR